MGGWVEKKVRETLAAKRVGNPERGRGLGGAGERLGMVADFFESPSQAFRIPREQRAGSVRQIFAFAANGKLDELADRGARIRRMMPAIGETATLAIAITPAAEETATDDHVGEHPKGADHDGHEQHPTDVEVLDVAEFMGEDAFEFFVFEDLDDAGRDGDRGVLRIAARCEGIWRWIIHHVQLRHRQPRGNGQVFDEVPEVGVLFAGFYLRCAGCPEDEFVAPKPRERRHAYGEGEGKRKSCVTRVGHLSVGIASRRQHPR